MQKLREAMFGAVDPTIIVESQRFPFTRERRPPKNVLSSAGGDDGDSDDDYDGGDDDPDEHLDGGGGAEDDENSQRYGRQELHQMFAGHGDGEQGVRVEVRLGRAWFRANRDLATESEVTAAPHHPGTTTLPHHHNSTRLLGSSATPQHNNTNTTTPQHHNTTSSLRPTPRRRCRRNARDVSRAHIYIYINIYIPSLANTTAANTPQHKSCCEILSLRPRIPPAPPLRYQRNQMAYSVHYQATSRETSPFSHRATATTIKHYDKLPRLQAALAAEIENDEALEPADKDLLKGIDIRRCREGSLQNAVARVSAGVVCHVVIIVCDGLVIRLFSPFWPATLSTRRYGRLTSPTR